MRQDRSTEEASGTPCPLCRGRQGSVVWSASYEQIWRQLSREWNVDVPADVRQPYDEIGTAHLRECATCGLQSFHPMLPGPGEFYELLGAFYVNARWEFDVVTERLGPDDRVIDFGCGRGAFLASLQGRVATTVGVDFNVAAHHAAHTGVTMVPAPFVDAAHRAAGEFDVAVSFHVLEHVSDVREVCDAARVALRPGGRFFVSVPDRERTTRKSFEVFDCPPHHVSRWSSRQFSELARHTGFELAGVQHEPFVHRTGARRRLPPALLQLAALTKHVVSREGAQPPRGLPIGTRDDAWPRGLAVMAELVRS